VSDPTVSPLRKEHRAQWKPLWLGYLRFYEAQLDNEVTERTWFRLMEERERVYGLGAFHDTELVGFVHYLFHRSTWSLGDYCYLEDLFVSPEARGRGVGRCLIEAVYAAADAEGAARVYWITSETNHAGRALYDKVAARTEFIHYRRK
jgi:GNAT superfamily N-acetyltransferase